MAYGVTGASNSEARRALRRLTIPGAVATAAQRYEDTINQGQREAVHAVEFGLEKYGKSGFDSRYTQELEADAYGLAGTDWANVLSPFVSETAKGVGARISGRNPYITSTTTNAPSVSVESPKKTWVLPVVIGASVLALGGLFFAFRK